MDKIRARSLLKYHYVYTPPKNVDQDVIYITRQNGLDPDQKNMISGIKEIDKKEKYFIDLGKKFNHFIPNSKLHKMKSFKDVVEFYSTEINNITKYAEMARSENLPKNLAISENPRRFHPNDKSAIHGGITATPGEGGRIFGIRSRRLYREFKPKKDWFDYEEENFNYDQNFSKGMPWDPEIARKMDSCADIRFTKDYLKKIK